MLDENGTQQTVEQITPSYTGIDELIPAEPDFSEIIAEEFTLHAGSAQQENKTNTEPGIYQESYDGLLPMLQQLDQRLAAAISVAEQIFAARAAGDLHRGLAITPADVFAALGRIPGDTLLPISAQIPALATITQSLSLQRLLWLQRVFALTDLDLDIILIALVPEIDLRYERLYAYLHDDVTRRSPSIDLALNLICATAADKLQQRQRFASDAPLLKHRLIEVVTNPYQPNTPLLYRYYRLDEQIMRLLLLDDSMDSRLAEFCQLVDGSPESETAPLTQDMQQQLAAYATQPPQTGLRLYFQGPAQCGQAEAVSWLATTMGLRRLTADFKAINANALHKDILSILVREVWFKSALLHINTLEISGESTTDWLGPLWQALKAMPADCVIEGEAVWVPAPNKPLGVVTLNFTYPSFGERKRWWQHRLRQYDLTTNAETTEELAQRYRMTYAQIQSAAALAAVTAKANQPNYSNSSEEWEDYVARTLFASARAQTGHELATLATKIEPRATWDDLILPEDQIAQLHEICNRFKYRDKVLNEWGYARKLSYGLGTTVLFSGSSGTGKTMAAEVIANALGLDLYRIDLSQVVNKYIGETEKNLDRVFTAAANANAILFFDEADALFGKRTEVKDAHDRYANLETSYLLQKMEQHEGIAILATNLSDNLDQAFTRRLAFSIHFPFPDETHRMNLWQLAWPEEVPMSVTVDRGVLASGLKLAGGNIKNIALRASFNAAERGGIVDMVILSEAIRREYQKEGRSNGLAGEFASLKTKMLQTPAAE
jgi:hypothetical protein